MTQLEIGIREVVVEVGIGISERGNTLEALYSRSIILLGICSATIGKAHLGCGGCIGSIELGDTCATEERAECHEESQYCGYLC